MRSALLTVYLRPCLGRLQGESEGEGVEDFVYLDDVTLGLTGYKVRTTRPTSALERDVDVICIVVNPAKAVALPPKEHLPKAGETSPQASVYVRTEEGGISSGVCPKDRSWLVRGMVERAGEAVRSGGGSRCSLPGAIPGRRARDKQLPVAIPTEPRG